MASSHHFILTGPPGVGKTTLTTKIVNILKSDPQFPPPPLLSIHGFYTAEIRDSTSGGGDRTGFQIITIDGKCKGTLSSIHSSSRYKIGKYGVELKEFESIALPQFDCLHKSLSVDGSKVAVAAPAHLLVLDEIGKMELFSEPFKAAVTSAFQLQSPSLIILATLPVPNPRSPIPFVEKIRCAPTSTIFTVTKNNRNTLVEEIVQKIKAVLAQS